jgi:hypothetical protein
VHVRPTSHVRLMAALLTVLPPLAVTACTSTPEGGDSATTSNSVAAVCDKMPAGPGSAPDGAVIVDPSIDGDLAAKTRSSPPGTTFWLLTGTHLLGDDRYDQVMAKDANTYLGAPGAIVDGRKINHYAFTGRATNVTIRHLTVQGFVPPHDEGVVNHDSGDGWVIEHNTIQNNSGAGMMAGARQQVRGNCLRTNGQYGINAFKSGNTITDLVVEGNEIVGNNTDDWEARKKGCGCTGGVKFWAVNGADIRGNWVHDNRGTGLWADTNNNDFLIEDNLIESNDGVAIFYETSYNAVIRNNTIRRNNWVQGREFADRGDNFPAATVYLSEAGGEPRIPARTDKIDVYGNIMEDNWSGITLWENADRFCNSPANTSRNTCTLLVADPASCAQPAISNPPLYDDCRWKTQRVDIHDNRFALNPSTVNCRGSCGRMGLLSNFGTYPDWSPYKGEVIQEEITFNQQNRWHNNTYAGPWTFVPHDPSQALDPIQWQMAPYQQDTASTFVNKAGG